MSEKAIREAERAYNADPSAEKLENLYYLLVRQEFLPTQNWRLSIDNQSFLDMIYHMLNHVNFSVRHQLVYELSKFDAASGDFLFHPFIVKALDDPEGRVQEEAISALKKYPADIAVPVLLKILESDLNDELKKEAIYSLDKFQDRRAVPFLIERLQSWELSSPSVRALGKIRDPRVVSALVSVLDHVFWGVRATAVQYLEEIQDPAAISALLQAYPHEKDNLVRYNISKALDSFREAGYQIDGL